MTLSREEVERKLSEANVNGKTDRPPAQSTPPTLKRLNSPNHQPKEAQQANKESLGIQVADLAAGIQQAAADGIQQAVAEDKAFLESYANQKLQNRAKISESLSQLRNSRSALLSEIAPEVELADDDFFGSFGNVDVAGLLPDSRRN